MAGTTSAAGTHYYSDSGCTTEIPTLGAGLSTCAQQTYALESISNATCLDVTGYPSSNQTKVHNVGAMLPAYWYKTTTVTTCTAATLATGYTYYSIDTTEVPPSTFAQGSVVTE